MKLIYCPECGDIIMLRKYLRKCECGASGGYYLADGTNAEIFGKAIPLGIGNHTFRTALQERPVSGNGKRFEAFVIPGTVLTIKQVKL
jgi:uncharacterized protein (DUF983 family)